MKRGEGVTPIRKISLQILAPPEKKRNIVFRNEGGRGGRLWKFSENSSVLVSVGVPYSPYLALNWTPGTAWYSQWKWMKVNKSGEADTFSLTGARQLHQDLGLASCHKWARTVDKMDESGRKWMRLSLIWGRECRVVNMTSNVTPAGFYGGRQFGWIQYRKLDSSPLERLGKPPSYQVWPTFSINVASLLQQCYQPTHYPKASWLGKL